MDYPFHAESQSRIRATAERVFAHLDDHERLAAHMSQRSWRMGWGRMELQLDERAGRAIGSRIRLDGRVFGVRLGLEEIVTEYEPPARKVWETVGAPRLLVIGPYPDGIPPGVAARRRDVDGVRRLRAAGTRDLPLARPAVRPLVRAVVLRPNGGRRKRRPGSGSRQRIDPAPSPRDVSPARDTATFLKASLFHVELATWLLAIGLALAARPRPAAASAALALGMDVAGRAWSRRSPVPMPYFMRWVLRLPRGPHAPARLLRSLEPRPGERILEIGPGVGIHAIPVAEALRPDGVLEALDMQQPMLDELARHAARHGVANIVTRRGDAQRLPYPDASFDAAYLVSVLGEIPDARAALRELRRVIRPAGRLLVCEVVLDPDFVSLSSLLALAAEAGLRFERKDGVRFIYTAVFRPMTSL